MIDTPNIVDATVQNTATIRLTVPRTQIQDVMGPAIQEVLKALTAQGARPTGPVFSYHLRLPADTFDFEVGVPVAKAVGPFGRVRPSILPAGRVAQTIYRGRYEGLGTAWAEFNSWIVDQGFNAAPTLLESYAVGPQAGSDSSAWETTLIRPLV